MGRILRALVLAFVCALALPGATRGEERVFVSCAAAQGNGFNWAATLGWMAAEAELAAARAAAWAGARPDRRAAVDLRCFTGSSSGAFAAAVLDALLSNPRLVSGRAGRGLATPAEAGEIGRALLFLALSADFRGEVVPLALDRLLSRLGLLERGDDAERLRPWRGLGSAGRIQTTAAHWIAGAEHYDPAWFADLIATIGPLPFRDHPARLAGPDGEADDDLRAAARQARRILGDRLGRDRATLGPPGEGICVTALVAPAIREATLPFAALDLVHACGAETVARLAASADLARWLEAAPASGARMLLATAPDWRTMIGLSSREPGLITPLSGPLDAPPIGLEAPLRFDRTGFAPEAGGPRLVMGGFAPPRLQAWSAAALLAEALDRHAADGAQVEGRLAIFGRTELRDDPTASFLQRAIVAHFSAAGARGITPELAAFHDWEDEFCAVARALAPRAEIAFLRMDWNLSEKPASLTRQSHVLAAKGFNLPRVQASDATRARGPASFFERFLHDPMDEARFLPEPPPGGIGCIPGAGGL
jgi:hypothetical protein